MQLVVLQLHGAGQCDGAPIGADALQQNLGSGGEPVVTVWQGYERNKQTRVAPTSQHEETLGVNRAVGTERGAACQDNLPESASLQLSVEGGEIGGIAVSVELETADGFLHGRNLLDGMLADVVGPDEQDGAAGRDLKRSHYEAAAPVERCAGIKLLDMALGLRHLGVGLCKRETVKCETTVHG